VGGGRRDLLKEVVCCQLTSTAYRSTNASRRRSRIMLARMSGCLGPLQLRSGRLLQMCVSLRAAVVEYSDHWCSVGLAAPSSVSRSRHSLSSAMHLQMHQQLVSAVQVRRGTGCVSRRRDSGTAAWLLDSVHWADVLLAGRHKQQPPRKLTAARHILKSLGATHMIPILPIG
jgi:hypothetical protein